MTKKKDETVSEKKEFTKTDAHTQSGRSLLPIEQILGEKVPAEIDQGKFLLKLKTGARLDKIVSKTKVKTNLESEFKGGLVLGPFSKSQIVSLCEEKLLTKRDELLIPQGTWKVVSDVISEVSFDQLASEDFTVTHSLTGSVTETQTATAPSATGTVGNKEDLVQSPLQVSPQSKVDEKPSVNAEAVKRGEATETIVHPVPQVQKSQSPSMFTM